WSGTGRGRGQTVDAADTRRRHQPPAGHRPAPSNTVARTANSPGMLAWSLAFWSTVTNDYQPRAPHPRRNAERPTRSSRSSNVPQQVRKPRRRVASDGDGEAGCSRFRPEPEGAAVRALRHAEWALRQGEGGPAAAAPESGV